MRKDEAGWIRGVARDVRQQLALSDCRHSQAGAEKAWAGRWRFRCQTLAAVAAMVKPGDGQGVASRGSVAAEFASQVAFRFVRDLCGAQKQMTLRI